MHDVLVLIACSDGTFHHSKLSKANTLFTYLLHMHVTWSLKFVGLYFWRCLWMLVRMQTCHCKNTCRRKSGRTRGCVCRDNGLPCSANCDCGPEGKPCSNRKEISSNAPAAVARLPSSAFDRHQAAAAKSREEIGVRNAAETMFMIAMNNNVSQLQISLRIVNSG